MAASTHSKDYRELIRRLRAARLEAGLTQGAVAKALGFTQTQVSKIERGERRVDAIELKRFAKLFKRPVTDFIP